MQVLRETCIWLEKTVGVACFLPPFWEMIVFEIWSYMRYYDFNEI